MGVVDSMRAQYESLQQFMRDDKTRAGEELEEASRLLLLAEEREGYARAEREAAQGERAEAERERAEAQKERERASRERAEARKADAASRKRLDEAKRMEEEAKRLEEEARRQGECAAARHYEIGEMLNRTRTEREEIEQALRAGKEEAALRKAQGDAERMRVKEAMTQQAEERAKGVVAAAEEEARLLLARAQEEARLMVEEARRKADAQAKRAQRELARAREMLEKDKAEATRAVEEMRESHRRIAPTLRRFVEKCEKHEAACEERMSRFRAQIKTFHNIARQNAQRMVSGILGIQLISRDLTRMVDELQCTMALMGDTAGSASKSSSGEERGGDAGSDGTGSGDGDCGLLLSEVDKLKDALALERRKTLVARGALERIRAVHAEEAGRIRADNRDIHSRYENSCFAAVNLAQALQENLCVCCAKKRESPPVGASMMVVDGAHGHKDLVFALCRPGFSGQKKQIDDLDAGEMRDLLRCCATTMGIDKQAMAAMEQARKKLEDEKRLLQERLASCFGMVGDTYDLVHGLQLVYDEMPREVKDMVLKMQLASHVQLEAVLKFLESASDDIDNGSDLVRALQEEEGISPEAGMAMLTDFSTACKGVLRFLRGLFERPDPSSQIGVFAFETLDCIINMPDDRVRDAERAVGFLPGTDKMCSFLNEMKEWYSEEEWKRLSAMPTGTMMMKRGKAGECAGCGSAAGGEGPRRLPGGEFKWGGEYDAGWINSLQALDIGVSAKGGLAI